MSETDCNVDLRKLGLVNVHYTSYNSPEKYVTKGRFIKTLLSFLFWSSSSSNGNVLKVLCLKWKICHPGFCFCTLQCISVVFTLLQIRTKANFFLYGDTVNIPNTFNEFRYEEADILVTFDAHS